MLKKPTFDWKAAEKYQELCNFGIEVNIILMTNSYNTQKSEHVLIVLNWLGWEGLSFVQTLNDEEQVKCRTSMGLLEVFSEKFKPQHNERILSLKYCKWIREENENAMKWMCYLRIKINKCGYRGKDRRIKEKFINGINDDEWDNKRINISQEYK